MAHRRQQKCCIDAHQGSIATTVRAPHTSQTVSPTSQLHALWGSATFTSSVRHEEHGGGTAEANCMPACQVYIYASSSWNGLHHNTKLTLGQGIENATINSTSRGKYLFFLLLILLVFSKLFRTFSDVNMVKGGSHHPNRTTTTHPSIRSHLTVACPWQLC